MTMELSSASALIGLSVVEVFGVFRDVAPTLKECRSAEANSPTINQGLLDAEIMAGITAVVLAGGAAFLTKSGTPLVLAAFGLLLITQYYRSVLRSVAVN